MEIDPEVPPTKPLTHAEALDRLAQQTRLLEMFWRSAEQRGSLVFELAALARNAAQDALTVARLQPPNDALEAEIVRGVVERAELLLSRHELEALANRSMGTGDDGARH